jgi:hypothetical protein
VEAPEALLVKPIYNLEPGLKYVFGVWGFAVFLTPKPQNSFIHLNMRKRKEAIKLIADILSQDHHPEINLKKIHHHTVILTRRG